MWLKILLISVLTTVSILTTVSLLSENKSSATIKATTSKINEQILSETENAYNPIPSSDGKMLAYVETGWNRNFPIGGLGRSNLKSNIKLMDTEGNVLSKTRLADAFLYGWTSDSKKLIAYRDWKYGLLSIEAPETKLAPFEAISKDEIAFNEKMRKYLSSNKKSDVDKAFRLLTKKQLTKLNQQQKEKTEAEFSERITYLEKENLFLWLKDRFEIKQRKQYSTYTYTERELTVSQIMSPSGDFLSFKEFISPDSTLFVTSPNQRYIAMIGTGRNDANNQLKIYDRENKILTNLGKVFIHPHESWDYIKPSWNPWFADSSKLVFVSDEGIIVSSPDGKDKKIISQEKENIGIPTPSPDGKMIAYATFEPRPMKERPDLKFYGGTTIWVKKIVDESNPFAVTNKNEDETYCLRWLNNKEIVFDRIADEPFYQKARIWKAKIQN